MTGPDSDGLDPDTTCTWRVELMSDGTYRFLDVRPLNPRKHEAAARLAEAAPDMLAALEMVLAHQDTPLDWYPSRLAQVRAAVDKARCR